MSTCQTETSINGAVMLVYSRERRGESPEDLWETSTSHTAVSRKLTSAHSIQPGRFSIIFWSTCENTPLSAFEAMQKVKVKPKRWRRASSLFPLERTRVKHLHHRSAWARQIHSLKISSSIQMIKAAADKPTRIASLRIHTLTDTCEESGCFQMRPHELCFGGASQHSSTGRGPAFNQNLKLSLIITVHCGAALSLLWKQWGSLFIWMNH